MAGINQEKNLDRVVFLLSSLASCLMLLLGAIDYTEANNPNERVVSIINSIAVIAQFVVFAVLAKLKLTAIFTARKFALVWVFALLVFLLIGFIDYFFGPPLSVFIVAFAILSNPLVLRTLLLFPFIDL